jgi:hypothetical protein
MPVAGAETTSSAPFTKSILNITCPVRPLPRTLDPDTDKPPLKEPIVTRWQPETTPQMRLSLDGLRLCGTFWHVSGSPADAAKYHNAGRWRT